VLQSLGQHQAALASYDRVLELRPAFAEAFQARGLTLMSLRKPAEALASYDQAIALNANFSAAYVHRGHVLHDLQRYEAAVRDYTRALELDADQAEIWLGLGSSLSRLKRHEEAIRSFDRALAVKPDQKYLIGLRQHAKMQICDWSDLAPALRRLEAGLEAEQAVSVPLTVLALVDSPPLHERVARIWVREECPPDDSLGVIANRPRSDRIRIGYFSTDFRVHPVSLLTAGLFETHDRSKFEITAFAFGSDADDTVRARLRRTFDHFIDVNTRSDGEVALLARERGIDIAVDLGGFTEHARTKVFAQRAAPLQISYLGYPGTSGAPYMDYLIADRVLVPEGAERHYSEQIIRLPDSYQPTDATRAISSRVFTREELGLPNGSFVFCCFNRSFKLMPETFDDWMQILKGVEGSVLWLSEGDKTAMANLRREAERRDVSPERLIFANAVPSMHTRRPTMRSGQGCRC
jgi:predicted O-linked N-acetylglucosamine transferase (SPINDLY family)